MKRVLIVGGGIAGSAFAGFCESNNSIEYTIVEKSETFNDEGYSISLWHTGLQVLKELAVYEDVVGVANSNTDIELKTTSGNRIDLDIPDVGDDQPYIFVHRADLHKTLLNTYPREKIQFGTIVTRIDDGKRGVEVGFRNQPTKEYDLVVGADGAFSRVRELVFDDARIVEQNAHFWTFWANNHQDLPTEITCIFGAGFLAGITPINGENLVTIGASKSILPEAGSPDEQLTAICDEFGGMLSKVVQEVDADVFHDQVVTVELDNWVQDDIALIGDAAHAVHPLSSMGTTLALKDAFVLSEKLSNHRDTRDALEHYQRASRTTVRTVRRYTKIIEKTLFSSSRYSGIGRALMNINPKILEKYIEWCLRKLK